MNIKKRINLSILLLLSIFLLSTLPAEAEKVWTPEMMPDVQKRDRREYVSDPANLLTPEVRAKINSRLYELRQQTSAEVVVALPPDIGDMTIEEWSNKLFSLWGIGKSDKDNGVLLVIAPGQRKARIETGYGVEGVLPDISCKQIIGRAIVPAMREDNIDEAVNNSTELIAGALSDPAVAEEIMSGDADNYEGAMETISADTLWGFVRIICWIVFLFAVGTFIRDLINGRKLRDDYQRALLWRNHLQVYFWYGIFSLGAGFIFFLLAFWRYRHLRDKKRICPNCGTKMNKLNEEDDNALLTPSQDFEERLKTVDYDVWECPECHTVERLPFKERQMKYSPCPSCGTVAMCLAGNRTLVPATTRQAGQGVKIYECKFCHHREERPYVIPRKEDAAAAAIAAGAILGSGRGGGGSHGGGFGGGFGGGMSGGGGASGGW
ncbi:MAG: TPM domain-containing protein [Muribaculaceae bacterium]|nr:TPM domain-containing protein [Muribaculaceae bacterium]